MQDMQNASLLLLITGKILLFFVWKYLDGPVLDCYNPSVSGEQELVEMSLTPSASAIEFVFFSLIVISAGLLRSQQSLGGKGCSAFSEHSDCQHGINLPFCACSCRTVENFHPACPKCVKTGLMSRASCTKLILPT